MRSEIFSEVGRVEYEDFEEFDSVEEWLAAQEDLALYGRYEAYADALDEHVPAPGREIA